MSKQNNKYGWYSQKQKEFYDDINHKCYDGNNKSGICIYLTPKGDEVHVTEVTESENPINKFDDNVYVSVVDKFVRKIY